VGVGVSSVGSADLATATAPSAWLPGIKMRRAARAPYFSRASHSSSLMALELPRSNSIPSKAGKLLSASTATKGEASAPGA